MNFPLIIHSLKKEKIEFSISKKILEEHSTDTSIFKILPKIVVFPKNSLEIKEIVKIVNKYKKESPDISLTCRAGGTDMTGGPLNSSMIINLTKHFNKIISFKPEKKEITLQPGVYYRDFESFLLSKNSNLFLPSYPASKSICAIGGMVANNAGGEKSINYGKTQDYVKTLKVILADGNEYTFKKINLKEIEKKSKQKNMEGEIYNNLFSLIKKNYKTIQNSKPQVSKNSAGYNLWDIYDKKENTFDLTKLFVGSQGTLGIITEITLSLVPIKKNSRLIICFLKSTQELTNFVNLVLPHKPESLETFDSTTLKLALKFLPEIAKKLNSSLLSLLWSFKKEAFINFFTIPKFTVLVEITDDSIKKLKEKIQNFESLLKKNKIKHLIMNNKKEGEKYWIIRRESFNLLRKKVKGKQAAAFIDDFAVLPKHLPKFWPELEKILEENEINSNIIGHAGSGNFHIIPLMNLSDEREVSKISKVSNEVYNLVTKYKGTITAEHNDGLTRTPYLSKMFSPKMLSLFEETKKIFDPKNIFNPNKKTNPILKESMEHIKK